MNMQRRLHLEHRVLINLLCIKPIAPLKVERKTSETFITYIYLQTVLK